MRCERGRRRQGAVCGAVLCAAVIAACGSGSGSHSGTGTSSGSQGAATSVGTPVNGGTLQAGMAADPAHLDPGLGYTNESWEIEEATNNGLLAYKRASGVT